MSPARFKQVVPLDKLVSNIETLIAETKKLDRDLQRMMRLSDLQSLRTVVEWLSGDAVSYVQLVEGIFGITPSKFSTRQIRTAQEKVEVASRHISGSNLSEKVMKWREESKISGEALKKMIQSDVVKRTEEIRRLFEKHVFPHLSIKVKNNGVIYKTAKGEPWTGYNYYQGNYTSFNALNVDRSFNKYRLIAVLCHEYEHHVANIFAERYYRINKALDMSVALLHTKGSIINEGTADCAREFLSLPSPEHGELVESLNMLGSIIGLNAAYMLNVEGSDDESAAEYVSSETFVSMEEARKSISFYKPTTANGKPNFFKPYVYTYYFGRKDYVLPTFLKARKKEKLDDFFRVLYLNPYCRSSATWETAFRKI